MTTDNTETVTDELRIDAVAPDGRPRVERKTVRQTRSSTVARHARLPPECAALVDGVRVRVTDLSADEREWVDSETGDRTESAGWFA